MPEPGIAAKKPLRGRMTKPDPEITWLAHYDDGSTLPQYAPDGTVNKYADVNRNRLLAFDAWQADKLLVRVDLRDDSSPDIGRRRLIWRIRHQLGTNGTHVKVYLIGWQRTVKGRNVQAINYLLADGPVMLGGQFNEADFTNPIVPFAWETDLLA